LTCGIPYNVLLAAPFYLQQGSTVNVQIIATNSYGSSLPSPVGSGITIVTPPSPPTNIQIVSSLTNTQNITFTWSASSSTGGQAIIDYRVSFD
jgi:hypothetical protein